MANDIVENCGTCRYFLDSGNVFGTCRRFPAFENRSRPQWCGEYVSMIKLEAIPEPVNEAIFKHQEHSIEMTIEDATPDLPEIIEKTVGKRGRKPKAKE